MQVRLSCNSGTQTIACFALRGPSWPSGQYRLRFFSSSEKREGVRKLYLVATRAPTVVQSSATLHACTPASLLSLTCGVPCTQQPRPGGNHTHALAMSLLSDVACNLPRQTAGAGSNPSGTSHTCFLACKCFKDAANLAADAGSALDGNTCARSRSCLQLIALAMRCCELSGRRRRRSWWRCAPRLSSNPPPA
jgi:hypothetical protein